MSSVRALACWPSLRRGEDLDQEASAVPRARGAADVVSQSPGMSGRAMWRPVDVCEHFEVGCLGGPVVRSVAPCSLSAPLHVFDRPGLVVRLRGVAPTMTSAR
eukprot:2718203-Pyramimonas_sp.AAC.1